MTEIYRRRSHTPGSWWCMPLSVTLACNCICAAERATLAPTFADLMNHAGRSLITAWYERLHVSQIVSFVHALQFSYIILIDYLFRMIICGYTFSNFFELYCLTIILRFRFFDTHFFGWPIVCSFNSNWRTANEFNDYGGCRWNSGNSVNYHFARQMLATGTLLPWCWSVFILIQLTRWNIRCIDISTARHLYKQDTVGSSLKQKHPQMSRLPLHSR